jgi:hypothetical protein
MKDLLKELEEAQEEVKVCEGKLSAKLKAIDEEYKALLREHDQACVLDSLEKMRDQEKKFASLPLEFAKEKVATYEKQIENLNRMNKNTAEYVEQLLKK